MKINKNILYTLWSAAIVVCVALSLFALLFASCSKPRTGEDVENGSGSFQISGETSTPDGSGDAPDTTAVPDDGQPDTTAAPAQTDDPAPDSTPGATSGPSTVRLGETEDVGLEYQDKIVFLGDSTTYGLKYYEVLTGGASTTQVWTPASGTLTLSNQSFATIVYPETGSEITIAEAAGLKKPEYMLITLGVNGVSFMDEEYFTSEYTALVKSIQEASPDTKIILNSIYPVAASYKYLDSINNTVIGEANKWIEKIAENTGTRYLNSCEAILGEDGFLPESYQNGDGIHLTGETFKLVLDYVRTHAYQ